MGILPSQFSLQCRLKPVKVSKVLGGGILDYNDVKLLQAVFTISGQEMGCESSMPHDAAVDAGGQFSAFGHGHLDER